MDFEFEFDPDKSEANKVKHGIDFVEAQELWKDLDLFILPGEERGEQRFLAFAFKNAKQWTAIFTMRGQTIRLISVRRSRDIEVELYEDNRTRRT